MASNNFVLGIVGIVASVLGVIGIVLGLVVGLYVVPAELEKGVEDSLVLTDGETDTESYDRFTKRPGDLDEDVEYVPYYRGHAAFVVTNPDEFVKGEAKANFDIVGPIWWERLSEKRDISFDDGIWSYNDSTIYEYAPEFTAENCVAGTCERDTMVTYINYGISNVLYPIAQQLDSRIDEVPAAGDAVVKGLAASLSGVLAAPAQDGEPANPLEGSNTILEWLAVMAYSDNGAVDITQPSYFSDNLNMRSGVGEAELKIYLGGLLADGAHSNMVDFVDTVLVAGSFEFFLAADARGVEVFGSSLLLGADYALKLTPLINAIDSTGTLTDTSQGDSVLDGLIAYSAGKVPEFLELKNTVDTTSPPLQEIPSASPENTDLSTFNSALLETSYLKPGESRDTTMFNDDYETYRSNCVTVLESLKTEFLGVFAALTDADQAAAISPLLTDDVFFAVSLFIYEERTELYAAQLSDNFPSTFDSSAPSITDTAAIVQVDTPANRFEALRRLLVCPPAANPTVDVADLNNEDCYVEDSAYEIASAKSVIDLIAAHHSRLTLTRSATVLAAIEGLLDSAALSVNSSGGSNQWSAAATLPVKVRNASGLSVAEVGRLIDMVLPTEDAANGTTPAPFQLEIILANANHGPGTTDPAFTVDGVSIGYVRGKATEDDGVTEIYEGNSEIEDQANPAEATAPLSNACVGAALYANGDDGTTNNLGLYISSNVEEVGGVQTEVPRSTLVPSESDPSGSGFAFLFVESALYSNIVNQFILNLNQADSDGQLSTIAPTLGGAGKPVLEEVTKNVGQLFLIDTWDASTFGNAPNIPVSAPLGGPQSAALSAELGAGQTPTYTNFFPCSGEGYKFTNWGSSFIKEFIDPYVTNNFVVGVDFNTGNYVYKPTYDAAGDGEGSQDGVFEGVGGSGPLKNSGSPLLIKTTLEDLSFGYTEPLLRLLSCDLTGECSESCVGTDTSRPTWKVGITNNFPDLLTANAVDSGLNDLKKFDNWAKNDGRTEIPPKSGLSESELETSVYDDYSEVVNTVIGNDPDRTVVGKAEAIAELLNIPAEFCDPEVDDKILSIYANAPAAIVDFPAPQGCGWNSVSEIITDGKGGRGIGPEWNNFDYTFKQAWNDHEGLRLIGEFDDVVADASERADRKAFLYYSSLLYRTSPLENKKELENKYDIKLEYYALPVDQLQINQVYGSVDADTTTIYPEMLDIYFASGLKNLYCQPFYFGLSEESKTLYTSQFLNWGKNLDGTQDLSYFVPNADDHEIHIDVEPFTGASMGGYLRLQANFYFPENTFNSIPWLNDPTNGILSNLSYGMSGNDIDGSILDDSSTPDVDESGYVVPALYALEQTEITEYFAGEFKDKVYGTQDLGDNITFGGVVAGALFLVNGGLLLAYNLSKTGSMLGSGSQGLAKRDSLASHLV